MSKYLFQQVKGDYYSVHYAIYGTNIYMYYEWQELLNSSLPNNSGKLIYKDGIPIGGITINNNHISAPFLILPFCDREEFWQAVINYAINEAENETVYFDNIEESHADIISSLGAKKRWAQRRMLRPTSVYNIKPKGNYYFTIPTENDMKEIIHVVYEAHLNGYTSIIYGKPVISDIEEAINRRFISFSQTNTLHFGTIAKSKDTNKIAAVCLAGIYPDSPNAFSTIHQVSVLPAHRRQGLAQAMILNSINSAHMTSPVIGLGVLAGNPAELLYQKLGFAAGPAYISLTYINEH